MIEEGRGWQGPGLSCYYEEDLMGFFQKDLGPASPLDILVGTEAPQCLIQISDGGWVLPSGGPDEVEEEEEIDVSSNDPGNLP